MRSILSLSVVLFVTGCVTVEAPVVPAADVVPVQDLVVQEVETGQTFEVTGLTGLEEEFVYAGKSGDIIQLEHREFTRDLEQPGFYRRLSHDLSKSLEFEVQGMKFEVVDATGLYLRFRLVRE